MGTWRELRNGQNARPTGPRSFLLLGVFLVVFAGVFGPVVASEYVPVDPDESALEDVVPDYSAMTMPAVEPEGPLWREVWIGADATARSWLLYSGMTLAPFTGIHDDGLRFRFASGYGQYRWKGRVVAGNGDRARGSGDYTYVDGLVGYLTRTGPLTTKAFAGVSLASHTIRELALPTGPGFDPGDTPISGDEIGVKLALEFWLNLGSKGWTSLDLNWTQAHDAYSARWRAAYRVWPTVSLGVEAIVNGDERYDVGKLVDDPGLEHLNRRGGAFIRYEWFGGEVSLAGGVSASADTNTTPYATLNWITQF